MSRKRIYIRLVFWPLVAAGLWVVLGYLGVFPTNRPLTNLIYFAGWVDGSTAAVDTKPLTYPGEMRRDKLQGDIFRDCAINYFATAYKGPELVAGVTCYGEADLLGRQPYIDIAYPLTIRSTSIPYSLGHNRALVTRLWKERQKSGVGLKLE